MPLSFKNSEWFTHPFIRVFLCFFNSDLRTAWKSCWRWIFLHILANVTSVKFLIIRVITLNNVIKHDLKLKKYRVRSCIKLRIRSRTQRDCFKFSFLFNPLQVIGPIEYQISTYIEMSRVQIVSLSLSLSLFLKMKPQSYHHSVITSISTQIIFHTENLSRHKFYYLFTQ